MLPLIESVLESKSSVSRTFASIFAKLKNHKKQPMKAPRSMGGRKQFNASGRGNKALRSSRNKNEVAGGEGGEGRV